ncbi:MAG TPA: hypothetical protein VJ724_00500, partial [Tahibacter sp.]|nr:hypothetical protein [Tahibacter sp.]
MFVPPSRRLVALVLLCPFVVLAASPPRPDAFVSTQVLYGQPLPDPTQFGGNVAVDGDWAILSNEHVPGSADLPTVAAYRRTADGWVFVEYLERTSPHPDDGFGESLALQGDTAVVGSYYHRGGGRDSVRVFVRSGTHWTEQATLRPGDLGDGDIFGAAVAIDRDTILVGSALHSAAAPRGAAYVFVRNGVAWTEQAKLVASDADDGAEFGFSVALAGDVAVVGANNEAYGGTLSAGAAYVFERSGGTWTQRQKLVADRATSGGYFGISVALRDDTLLVGSLADLTASNVVDGTVYVFGRTTSGWTPQARLRAGDVGLAQQASYFGRQLALGDDLAVVGAGRAPASGVQDAGAAYVYVRGANGWTHQSTLTSTEPGVGFAFGANSMGLSGHTLFVNESMGQVLVQRPARETIFENLALPTRTAITALEPVLVQQGQDVVVRVSVTSGSGTPTGTVVVDDGHGDTCTVDLALADRCMLRAGWSPPPTPPWFDPGGPVPLTATYTPRGPVAYL